MMPICCQVAFPKSPNCQNTTFVSSTSSAKYWRMVEAPDQRADRATPTRMMLSGRMRPSLENASTMRLDAMAPTNANRAVVPMPTMTSVPASAGTTTRMASVAPNAAPWEMPTVEAEANGFSSTPLQRRTGKAKPAPKRWHTPHGAANRLHRCDSEAVP